jgi:2-polyprenyl-3-methyl-5-hydroxy-6-metoxy-1,4-benzoquinol methylase
MMPHTPRDLLSYAREYGEVPFENVQAAIRRRVVLEQVRRVRPAKLLEVGCGRLPLFVDLPDISCDVVEPAVAFALEAVNMALKHKDARVHQLMIEDFADTTPFDMVVASGLLHEVASPKDVLRCIRTRCRPGGAVHVNVPNARSMHRLLAVAMGLAKDPYELSEMQHRLQQSRTYDLDRLQDEVTTAGFDVTDCGSYFVKPFTHTQMQHLKDSGVLSEQVLDGLAALAELMPGYGSEIFVNAKAPHG